MPLPLPALIVSGIFAHFLAATAVAIVARIMFALGIGIAIYTGVDAGLTTLKTDIDALVASLSNPFPQLLAILQIAGIPDLINMIFAAMIGVLTIRGIAGAFKQLGIIR